MEHNKHFLVVTYPIQSHINPGLHLANSLTHFPNTTVTFSTSTSAHRRMFPNTTAINQEPPTSGKITFIPYADTNFKSKVDALTDVAPISLSTLIRAFADDGRPVTSVIYTIGLTWAADVSRQHNIPSIQFWIQPATIFLIYYHYFHGYDRVVTDHKDDPLFTVNLPNLPPLQIRDLPSFITSSISDGFYSMMLPKFKENFDMLDRDFKPKVLVNSFDELEPDVFSVEEVELIAIGPIVSNSEDSAGLDLIKSNEKQYMEWLDSKADKSVVYVSFGSISVIKKEQMEEILRGLRECKRPYLWVVRQDSRWEGLQVDENGGNGLIVEWCNQVKVLSHRAVGCFVTHCGWNSTAESLVSGTPMVGVPQWTEQVTNAKLVEREWGVGVRGENNEDGVLESGELKRCLDLVMGDGEGGVEIRKKAEFWKEKAREATEEGGSSYKNLKSFVEDI